MPQPVDIQTEVVRVSAAERIQQIADRASLAAQQRAEASEQETRIDVETAVHQPLPKGPEVDTEARRRNPYVGRRRGKGKGSPQSRQDKERRPASAPPEPASGQRTGAADGEEHHFDVTI